MSFADDLAAAQQRVAAAERELQDAKAALAALEAMQVKGGPDVSEHNGDVDWQAVVAAGWDWAGVRVSDGDYSDKVYGAGRVAALRSSGIRWSPYHYARIAADANGQRTGRAEAAMAYYFAARAGWGRAGDLPLVYDVEQDPGEDKTFQGQAPAKAVAHAVDWITSYRGLTGHYPWLYSNPATLKLLLAAATTTQQAVLIGCPLWIAHWGVAVPDVPAGFKAVVHQTTNAAKFAGITAACDANRVLVSKVEMDALRIK